eukprot:c22858_g1_i1 orf=126-2885(+)
MASLSLSSAVNESSGIPTLSQRYMEACEKHGVAPNLDIRNTISKAKGSASSSALKLNLEQLTETDMMPLADMLTFVNNSDYHAVDIVHNKEVSFGQVLLRVMRSVGPKLRLVDLKKATFGRDVLRDLLHRGMQCQYLNLSLSRFRKLDMIGHFPQLHTLILDFSVYLTDLPEGCFRATPNLAEVSMCETKVANLWTTCAALTKVPTLVELRFQSCKCCEGTGHCRSLLTNERPCFQSEESTYFKHVGNIWNMDTTPMSIDDFVSLDSEWSNSSNTDGSGDDELFSDDDSAMILHPVHTSSEYSSVDSEGELEGQLLEVMSVEDDMNYQGDIEHILDLSDVVDEKVEAGAINNPASIVHEGGEVDQESGFITKDTGFFLPTVQQDSFGSPDTVSTMTAGHGSPEDSTTKHRLDIAETEEGLLYSSSRKKSVLLRRGGFHHPSLICSEKHYRDFLIAKLPGLNVLDNIPITQAEREKAYTVFVEHFENLPNNRHKKESIVKVLKGRETSSWIATSSSSKSMAGMGSIGISFTRSMCALKMSSNAWPSCVPLCKEKNTSSQQNRKYKPRQFEYHPTDPALMVFGTLHGEVVVVNHENDKIVGQVQSNGSSHSILGLCWLNKDPNKLIAGADNGSLQLYDVDRMRAMNGSVLNTLDFGSRLSEGNPGRSRRNPVVYVYENFELLTSVHVNSSDEYFLASGYSRNVGLYDLCTGKQLQVFNDLHQQHINVVKFAHHSPNLFATSSFDKEIKMWDLRQRVRVPLYTVRSMGGNVMVCFSRDDYYLLSSAVDNEVRQHLAVDGRLQMRFDIPSSGSSQNYTRSYYMNGRDYIISGSCEENVVRIYCAQTGRRLRDLALEGRDSKTSIYVQSLRGDPFRDFHFSVLAAHFQPHPKSEILKVNLLASSIHKKSSDIDSQHKLPAGMGA